ncbi:MAG: GspE/PulE family protein, partial [bacterium]|nr:GspE/PulE family protein [bacterium]
MATVQQTLSRLSRQTEEKLAREKATSFNYPYENLEGYPVNFKVLSSMTENDIRRYQVVPYLKQTNKLKVGLVHPENKQTIAWLRQFATSQKLTLNLVIISQSSLNYLVNVYDQLRLQQEVLAKQQTTKAQEAEQHNYAKLVHTLADLQKFAANVSTTELLDVVIAAAVNLRSSDIHIEPGEGDIVIRFRIDGVLQPAIHLSTANFKPLISRIKLHANLKLDLGDKPQDGRFTMVVGEQVVDFRVSSLPSQYGESIVMRILRQDIKQLQLEQLGFSGRDLQLINESMSKPYGMIVITGPTGSGKTTTLYAILNKLNTLTKKIITLEDPIEYRLEGIEQSQMDHSKNYSFSDALRATLRQDPDIIMLGEVRDEETARIALNAALTGHLVLTTIHANNAVMAMPRLADMGIEPFFLSGSINLIIAQRLVRLIDKEATATAGQTVYTGRTIISEVIKPSAEFERAVIKKEDYTTVLQIAQKDGMTSMIEDGRRKVKDGLTTEEEILRVTQ